MKRKLLIASVSVIALIGILLWIQGAFHSKIPPGKTDLHRSGKEPPNTVKAALFESSGSVTVSGTVTSQDMARVASRVLGYVTELKVYEGDAVKKGQVLLRIDTKEASERLQQSEANLDSAKAELTRTANDFERYKILYEKESVAKKDYDDAYARYEVAKAAESRAQAAVDEAKTMVSYGAVTAPFDGIVAERSVNVGDLATPGKPLLTIYMPGSLELIAQAGEQYAQYLKIGAPVEVSIPSISYSEKTTIREVVPQRDERTRSITIKASLPPKTGLNPGLYGALTFNTRETKTVVIPAKAVITVGQLESVKIWENGRVFNRHVKTGRKLDNDKMEIISGLNTGEDVILP